MGLFGFEFNYNKKHIGKSRSIGENDIVNIGFGKSNLDSMVIHCKSCGTYMDFKSGPSSMLDGCWVCPLCGTTVREKTAYTQLDKENTEYLKNLEFDDGDIPEGCMACGGPWPSCETSCNILDD